jgi:hypothetical protein
MIACFKTQVLLLHQGNTKFFLALIQKTQRIPYQEDRIFLLKAYDFHQKFSS